MGIIIDIVLLAILALNIFFGYKKGLINVVFNVFAFLIALIATLILFKPISYLIINNTQIQNKIETTIKTNLQSEKEDEKSNILETKFKNIAIDTRNQTVDVLAKNISTKAIEIFTAIILFIIIRIALLLLKFLAEGMAELPLIKQFNHAGGVAYGILKSVIIIYLIIFIIFLIISLKGSGTASKMVDESYLTKILYSTLIRFF